MTTTEHSDVVFELKEYGDGTPWLFAAFGKPGLSCVGDNMLGLQFRDGVTFEQAKEFRSLLHKMVKGISYTRL
ncbi:MAG: hypothetical protein ACYCOR_21825 [Acidobacteriaceae bacterium]